jgi:hypothetical protein
MDFFFERINLDKSCTLHYARRDVVLWIFIVDGIGNVSCSSFALIAGLQDHNADGEDTSET